MSSSRFGDSCACEAQVPDNFDIITRELATGEDTTLSSAVDASMSIRVDATALERGRSCADASPIEARVVGFVGYRAEVFQLLTCARGGARV
jgi:hypothetical protein